jgi:hypothetical protein
MLLFPFFREAGTCCLPAREKGGEHFCVEEDEASVTTGSDESRPQSQRFHESKLERVTKLTFTKVLFFEYYYGYPLRKRKRLVSFSYLFINTNRLYKATLLSKISPFAEGQHNTRSTQQALATCQC